MQHGMIDKLSSRFDRTVPKAKSCGTANVRDHAVVSAGGVVSMLLRIRLFFVGDCYPCCHGLS
jgi:hypothetical protein